MKRKFISIILMIVTLLIVVLSTCFVSFSSLEKRTGFPAYIVQKFECTTEHGRQETEVVFNSLNMILFFCAMNIPVFFAGYLWATSKAREKAKESSALDKVDG